MKLTSIALTMATVAMAAAAPAHADGDAVNGEKVFKKCMACHTATEKTNKVGPYLLGVVGRPIAAAENYNYSDAMKEYALVGKIWDEKNLDVYLEAPKAVVAKTKMAFPGLKKPEDRLDVIAYLKSKI
jgi:cytochrome c